MRHYICELLDENHHYHTQIAPESRFNTLHTHEYYELAYIYDGIGTHICESGTERIKCGNFIFISPGASHCTISEPDYNIPPTMTRNLLFEINYFKKAINTFLLNTNYKNTSLYKLLNANQPFCLILSDDINHSVERCLMAISAECEWYNHSMDLIVDNYLQNFFAIVSRIYDMHLNINIPVIDTNTQLLSLKNYIKTNLELPLTLNILAQQIHMSPAYLSRYFKEKTGENIWDYLTEVRLEKAKYYLQTTKIPISEICYLCGYPSISNFRRAFTKLTGQSPKNYRNIHNS